MVDENKKEEEELDEEDEDFEEDSSDDVNEPAHKDHSHEGHVHDEDGHDHDHDSHSHSHEGHSHEDHDHSQGEHVSHKESEDDKDVLKELDEEDEKDEGNVYEDDSDGDDKKDGKEEKEDDKKDDVKEEKDGWDDDNDSIDSIKIDKGDLWKYATYILIIAVIIGGFIYFRGGGFGSTGNVVADLDQVAPNVAPPEIARVQVSADDDAVKGDPKAKVEIIEFSDYECPFCGNFYRETLSQIKTEYIDTGKAKFIYRDFPLNSIHPQAQKAAEAAECAGEQDKYYDMHDMLFENGVQGGPDIFKQYAGDIGLDIAKFSECLDTSKMASEVQKDFQDGQRSGVSGTPAFFVNGKLVSGAQPFSVFKELIDAELA